MKLNELYYIVSVAECGSFSEAAKKLFVGQSAISQAIRRVELEYGVTLFERTAKGVKTTSDGALFIQYAKDIIHDVNRLNAGMQSRAKTNKLFVGAGSTGMRYYLPEVLNTFSREHPEATVILHQGHSTDMNDLLLDNKLDICLLHNPITDSERIKFVPLFRERLLVAVPSNHHLVEKHGKSDRLNPKTIDLLETANDNFILWSSNERFAKRCRSFCENAGFEPNVVLEINNFESINEVVASGLGISFVPDSIHDTINPNRPNYYMFESPLETYRYYGVAYLKAKEKNKAIQSFTEICMNTVHKPDTR